MDGAKNVKWVDVQENGIWIHGDSEHGTKSNERRLIPIIPSMATLLTDLRENSRYNFPRQKKASPFDEPPGLNPHRLSPAVGVALDPPDGSGTKSRR